MEVLDKLKVWLEGFDPVEGGYRVDAVPEGPGRAAIFPKGTRILDSREDIRGRQTVEQRVDFLVYRTFYKEGDGETRSEALAWVQGLQAFVQEQTTLGLCPRLGNVDRRAERIWAEEGRFEKAPSAGIGLYTVKLHARYKMRYEEERNG